MYKKLNLAFLSMIIYSLTLSQISCNFIKHNESIKMIFITQLIYILDGQEAVFNQFEAIAIPSISRYNGRLLLRVRPDEDDYIESTIEKPYEIHLVQFETENDFANFMQDEDRKRFLHLKEQSIKSVLLIKGIKL